MRPLAALRLMTGNGIGELHLQGIVVAIFLHFLHTLRLLWDVGIVGQNALIELLLLLAGKCRGLAAEGVKQNGGGELIVIVVGERQRDLSEAEAVLFVNITETLDNSNVAVGDELKSLLLTPLSFLLTPEIVVFHHHEAVAATKFVLAVEDRTANALIIDIRPFVGASDNDSIVETSVAVAGSKLLDELVATNDADILESIEMDFGE